jgi:hypothetical protein
MEIVYILAILAAFMLGAHVRRPFFYAKKKAGKPEAPELTAEQKKAALRAQTQLENLLNAGNPNYKQQHLED